MIYTADFTYRFLEHDLCCSTRLSFSLSRGSLISLHEQSWLTDSLKQQRNSRLDFIFGVNERRCGAKPVYGREVLDFLTFLPGPRPSPAALKAEGEWGRSGHSSCLYAQWQNTDDFCLQSPTLREAIKSLEARLELLREKIER